MTKHASLHPRAALGLALITTTLTAAAPVQAQSADRQARVWAASCATCHGRDGRAQGPIPALAGRDVAVLLAALGEFKTGQRPAATVMHQHSKGYSDDELRRIAQFYASLPAR